jgi:hypothetical protein
MFSAVCRIRIDPPSPGSDPDPDPAARKPIRIQGFMTENWKKITTKKNVCFIKNFILIPP